MSSTIAPLTTGALVRAKSYVSGGSSCPGASTDDFWGAGPAAGSGGCGFGIDTRKADKYGGGACGTCSPLSCGCGSNGCNAAAKRTLDEQFEDLRVSRPLDHLYGDADSRIAPLQHTRFSSMYSLRCPPPVTQSEACPQQYYQSSFGPGSVRTTARFHVGP